MRSTMRALLPLAVLLLGLQLAAAGRSGRTLLQSKPRGETVNLTRQQFVQATWALEGVTCQDVATQLNDQTVNNTLARAVIADFQTALIAAGTPAAAKTVVAVRQPCANINVNGEKYASYRLMVRFNSTTTTDVRDLMFGAVGTGAAGRCTGGYNKLLYRNVTALFARGPFKVSQNNGNRQNAFFPNGAGSTGYGDNWVEYASPAMSVCNPASPSPSPVVPSPSPSPSPEVPSPSPSPSPSPNPCPDGAAPDASGACVCNSTLFTPAFNGSTLIACINGTNLASCPASAPVEVKTLAAVPVIVRCITESTPCPSGFELILYNGNPSVRQECRPNQGGCNYAGFGLQVTRADSTLIGCVNATSNACPFVAFRSASNSFAVMERCVDTTSCPVATATTTAYTVPALAAGASTPSACLTLGSTNACPDIEGLRYPVEVMFAEPTSPVCGSAAQPCTQATVRAVQCLTPNTTCPSGFTLRMWRNSPATNNSATPVLAECRQTRSNCDLTAAGMTSNDPNAADFAINVKTGDALDGCVISTSTVCPTTYPFNKTDASGRLTECSTTAPPPPTPISCTATQIPLLNKDGGVVRCQDIATAAGALIPCPNDFPISLRKDISGNLGGCMALNSTCPAAFNSPMYSFFTGITGVSATALTLTNCWATGVVTSCNNIILAAGAQPAGIAGTYGKSIMSNATGSERTIGCIVNTATTCPAAYPFAYLDATAGASPTGTMAAPTAMKCSPAGEVTACPAPVIPAAGGASTSFSKPAYTKNTLSACIKGDFVQANPSCPTAFPIVALSRLDPAATGAASIPDSEVVGCWSSDSTCANTPSPFVLQGSAASSNIAYCVPQVVGLQTCSGFPVNNYATATSPGIYTPDSTTLIGCVYTGLSCPASFPIYFRQTPNGGDQRCQASISGTCASVAAGGYSVTITSVNGAIAGCVAAASQCNAGQIPLSNTADGAVRGCSSITTSCADAAFPFPLYENTAGAGAALARCLPAQTATDCNGATFNGFPVEVFGTAAGGGNVVGCMKSTVSTICPTTAPVPFMVMVPGAAGADPSFNIDQCRPAPATCAATDIPLKSSDGSTTLGCLAAGATTCPRAITAAGTSGQTTPATQSPYGFPIFLVGSAAAVEECRQLPITGTFPASNANACANLLGAATLYTTAINQLGFTGAASNQGNLAGCAKAKIVGCPAGYTTLYTGADITGCQTSSTCAVGATTIYSAAGVAIGCGDAASCGTNGVYGASRILLKDNLGSQAPKGCMPGTAAACPATVYTFSIYGTATGTAPARTPQLSECWDTTTAVVAACGGTVTGSPINDATVVMYDVAARTTRIGCTLPNAYCPAGAPVFRVPTNGILVATGTDANSYCFKAQPTTATGCPVTGSGATAVASIPVRGSNVAGDNSASYVGCINAPTGTADLGGTVNSACPSALPVANPAGADYTFFVASGIAVATAPIVTQGNIIECRLKDATRQCGSLLPVRNLDSTTPAGCFALAGNMGTCPSGSSFTTFNGWFISLWGPVSASDPTARLEACVTTNSPAGTQRSCAGIVPANTYTVPVTSQAQTVAPPADGVVGNSLLGCMKSTGTNCPVTNPTATPQAVTYPMIGRSASGDFTIQACRGTQATTCAAGYVPLCNADTNALTATTTAAAACSAAAENLGCLLQGGAVSQCAALSANRYPANGVTANPYKFVAAIQNAQTATLLACATMGENAGTPVTNCKVAATFTQKAYPAGTSSGATFRGCTDQTTEICTAWWSSLVPTAVCAASS